MKVWDGKFIMQPMTANHLLLLDGDVNGDGVVKTRYGRIGRIVDDTLRGGAKYDAYLKRCRHVYVLTRVSAR